MTEFKAIIVEKKGDVGRLVLNKPPLNVLDIAMMREVNAALESFKRDENLKVLVIASAQRAFSAGVDIRDHTAEKVNEMIAVFHNIFRNLREMQVPTVAAVNGAALGGGCELAIGCNMVIASDKATFGQPEIKVGVFPPIAALMFPKLVGRKKAMELILSGDIIPASEARDIGLVNQVYPADKFEEEANKFLEKIAANSAIVLRLAKQSVCETIDMGYDNGIKKVEDIYINKLMKTEDANEGLKAFMEKRKPVWKNK